MGDWGAYKPVVTALLLPPVPFLLLVLIGARLILPRRGLGYSVLILGVLGLWFSNCHITAVLLQNHVLKPPPALLGPNQARLEGAGRTYAQQEVQLRRSGHAAAVTPPAAIIALGGGRDVLAPQYGTADLSAYSAERLRYAIWLGRRTGLPIGFSGGIGWGQKGEVGASEAEIAARVAQQFYGVNLKWTETESADTRQNAAYTVAMLAEQGVPEIVLVTDAFHMPRARQVFVDAAQRLAAKRPDRMLITVTPAPLGYWRRGELDWLPSLAGAVNVRVALKECIALMLAV